MPERNGGLGVATQGLPENCFSDLMTRSSGNHLPENMVKEFQQRGGTQEWINWPGPVENVFKTGNSLNVKMGVLQACLFSGIWFSREKIASRPNLSRKRSSLKPLLTCWTGSVFPLLKTTVSTAENESNQQFRFQTRFQKSGFRRQGLWSWPSTDMPNPGQEKCREECFGECHPKRGAEDIAAEVCENQQGTAGRGRQKKNTTIYDILWHFWQAVTSYQNFRLFLLFMT